MKKNFRNHNQPFPARPRGENGPSATQFGSAGLNGREPNLGTGRRLLHRFGGILRSVGDRGSPRKAVDIRVPGHFVEALSFRFPHTSGDDRTDASNRGQQHTSGSSGKS